MTYILKITTPAFSKIRRCSRLMAILLTGLLLSGVPVGSFAQSYLRPENNVWLNGGYIGEGIDFNSGTPVHRNSSWQSHYHGMGSASICDASGNLLFYSDGNIIWDRNNDVMQHGWDVNNNGNMTPNTFYIDPVFGTSSWNFDGVVILPMPGSSHKYYVFSSPLLYTENSIGLYSGTWQGKLFCSVVDMELNNGLGGVDSNFRGVVIAEDMAGNLHAVAGEDCNYWLLGFGADGSYKAFNITVDGIDTTPVISTLTPPLSPTVSEFNLSPDRRKAAMAYGSEVQVTDFDPATGVFSNEVLIGSQSTRHVAFSPNSRYIYLSGLIGLRQYDLTNLNTPFTLLTFNNLTAYEYDAPLRLAPDGKIYLSYYTAIPGGSESVGAHIQQPDVFGPGCQMELLQNVSLPLLENDWVVDYAFPNEIPVIVYDTASEVQEVSLCFNQPVMLSREANNGTDFHWMVNTVGTTYLREGDDETSSLTASVPGTYAVQYYTRNPCTFHRDTFIVNAVNYSLYLGADQLSCDGTPIELDAKVDGAEFLWNDGSTDPTLEAATSGQYWVEVAKEGCTASDTVNIRILDMEQDLGPDTMICLEDEQAVTLQAEVPDGGAALWSNGATTSGITVAEGGVYWVEVTIGDCLGADSIAVEELYCDCPIMMPNAFSPNGDGINDQFRPGLPAQCPVSEYAMQIYNRWGQMIFVSYVPQDGWDGTIAGKTADAGVYYYQLFMYTGLRGVEVARHGEFILIR